jgi:hypothetical protein
MTILGCSDGQSPMSNPRMILRQLARFDIVNIKRDRPCLTCLYGMYPPLETAPSTEGAGKRA